MTAGNTRFAPGPATAMRKRFQGDCSRKPRPRSAGASVSEGSSPAIFTYPPSGSAEIRYSVSPRCTPNRRGPKRIEKRSTFTRSAFATRKCPSSWTKMSPPRRRTIAPILNRRSGISRQSSGSPCAVPRSPAWFPPAGSGRSSTAPEPPLHLAPPPGARGERLLRRPDALGGVRVERGGARVGDVGEPAAAGEERRDRRLVGAGEDGRRGPAHLERPVGEPEGGE